MPGNRGRSREAQVTFDKARKVRGVRSFPVDDDNLSKPGKPGKPGEDITAIGVVGKKTEGPDPHPHLPFLFYLSQPAATRGPAGNPYDLGA